MQGLQRRRQLGNRDGRLRFIERLRRARNGDPTLKVISTPTVITVVGQYGRVVALAAHTGQVLWRAQAGMQRVSSVAANPRALALAGVHGSGEDASRARLELLDPITGERLQPPMDQSHNQAPRWVGFAAGRVIVAAAETAQAYRLDDGQPAWRFQLSSGQFTGQALSGKHWLGLVDVSPQVRLTQITLIDPTTGQKQDNIRFNAAGGVSGETTAEHCHLTTTRLSRAIDKNGRLAWRDAISLTDKRLTAQAVTERYVLVTGHPAADEQSAQRLFFLDRQSGRLKQTYRMPHQLAGEPAHTLVPAATGLALSGDERTLLVPGRAEPR
jgi:outer membrane protein assembly factor BamB